MIFWHLTIVVPMSLPKLKKRDILTPLHRSRQTFTTPLKRTKLVSGNLKAWNLALSKSPSSVRKFSNSTGSTVHLKWKKVVGDDYHNDLFDGKKCNGCEINSVFFQDLEPHLKFTIGVVTHYMPNAKIAISCTSSSRNSSILLYLCCRHLFKDSHVF